MYVKPPHRQMHGMYVPNNYNGTAFTEAPSVQANEMSEMPEPQSEQHSAPLPESVPAGKTNPKSGLSSLFSGFGGLRSDDLLLLALILLMSRSDGENQSTSEILPLLALLLFLG